MSVTVSYISTGTTDNGTGWTNHTHDLARRNIEVPSVSEFENLETLSQSTAGSVRECKRNIDVLTKEVKGVLTQVKTSLSDTMMDFDNKQAALRKVFQDQFSAGGEFFTLFGKMTQGHMDNVQKVLTQVQSCAQKVDEQIISITRTVEQVHGEAAECTLRQKQVEQSIQGFYARLDRMAEFTAQIESVGKQLAAVNNDLKVTQTLAKHQQQELEQLQKTTAERQKELATLDRQCRETRSGCQEMLSACAVFRQAKGSWIMRIKWLLGVGI